MGAIASVSTHMKTPALALTLLAATALHADQKPSKDYPVSVLVRCNRLRMHHGTDVQQIGVVIDGKPYEFVGEAGAGILSPGTYQARIADPNFRQRRVDPWNIDKTYELLLPNGHTWKVALSGVGYDPCTGS